MVVLIPAVSHEDAHALIGSRPQMAAGIEAEEVSHFPPEPQFAAEVRHGQAFTLHADARHAAGVPITNPEFVGSGCGDGQNHVVAQPVGSGNLPPAASRKPGDACVPADQNLPARPLRYGIAPNRRNLLHAAEALIGRAARRRDRFPWLPRLGVTGRGPKRRAVTPPTRDSG